MNLSIIFHSGSFDKVSHGLSIALAGGAMERKVLLFFTYDALGCLVKGKVDEKIKEPLILAKRLGVKIYACTSSMGLLNISRDELTEEVDKSMGITTFLSESSNAQMLFI